MSDMVVVFMGVEEGSGGYGKMLVLRQKMILKIFLTPYKNFPSAPKVMVLKLLCALESFGVLVRAHPHSF